MHKWITYHMLCVVLDATRINPLLYAVPDLGLWRPLGNNIIENTSTPWSNKFNDCKDICGIIMVQLTMSRNVAATQTVTIFCP